MPESAAATLATGEADAVAFGSGWTGSTIADFWSPSASSRRPEAEERYFAMLNDKAMAASLKRNGLGKAGAVQLYRNDQECASGRVLFCSD